MADKCADAATARGTGARQQPANIAHNAHGINHGKSPESRLVWRNGAHDAARTLPLLSRAA